MRRLLDTYLPEFINDRSAYYQNEWFDRIASDPSYRIPIFNAGTLTDPLFTSIETIRMVEPDPLARAGYPIKEYYGDYEHFVQNKAKEWADICGADRHVCTNADYAGGDLNANPTDLAADGRAHAPEPLHRPLRPAASNPAQAAPTFDVTASAQICAQNASAEFPADEPGQTFVASSFAELAPYRFTVQATGSRRRRTTPTRTRMRTRPTRSSTCASFRTASRTRPLAGPDVAVYDSDPLVSPETMVGATEVSVDYTATTAEGLQLNARLYDVFPDGTHGAGGPRPVPRHQRGGNRDVQLHGNGWRFEPGHRIRIEIAQDDDPS